MIIMTAHGTISSAVEAMKKGAFDYLTKPLNKDSLRHDRSQGGGARGTSEGESSAP